MRATKLYFIDHVKLSLLFLHFQKNINKMENMPGKATKIEILQMACQKLGGLQKSYLVQEFELLHFHLYRITEVVHLCLFGTFIIIR